MSDLDISSKTQAVVKLDSNIDLPEFSIDYIELRKVTNFKEFIKEVLQIETLIIPEDKNPFSQGLGKKTLVNLTNPFSANKLDFLEGYYLILKAPYLDWFKRHEIYKFNQEKTSTDYKLTNQILATNTDQQNTFLSTLLNLYEINLINLIEFITHSASEAVILGDQNSKIGLLTWESKRIRQTTINFDKTDILTILTTYLRYRNENKSTKLIDYVLFQYSHLWGTKFDEYYMHNETLIWGLFEQITNGLASKENFKLDQYRTKLKETANTFTELDAQEINRLIGTLKPSIKERIEILFEKKLDLTYKSFEKTINLMYSNRNALQHTGDTLAPVWETSKNKAGLPQDVKINFVCFMDILILNLIIKNLKIQPTEQIKQLFKTELKYGQIDLWKQIFEKNKKTK